MVRGSEHFLLQFADRLGHVEVGGSFVEDRSGLVALTLQSLGELERQEGRLDRARTLLERSLAIIDKAGATNSGDVDTLVSLGLVDESQGRLTEAAAHLGHAHEIYVRLPGIANRDVLYWRSGNDLLVGITGTSDALGTIRCPLLRKKSRNCCRISLEDLLAERLSVIRSSS